MDNSELLTISAFLVAGTCAYLLVFKKKALFESGHFIPKFFVGCLSLYLVFVSTVMLNIAT